MLARFVRHWLASFFWHRRFSRASLARIGTAIAAAESGHRGEICFVVEGALSPGRLWRGLSAAARAQEVFAELRVWDTEHRTGVLVYVLLAERAIEILSDRGLRVPAIEAAWPGVIASLQHAYARRDDEAGTVAAIHAIGELLRQHLPCAGPAVDELPNIPRQL